MRLLHETKCHQGYARGAKKVGIAALVTLVFMASSLCGDSVRLIWQHSPSSNVLGYTLWTWYPGSNNWALTNIGYHTTCLASVKVGTNLMAMSAYNEVGNGDATYPISVTWTGAPPVPIGTNIATLWLQKSFNMTNWTNVASLSVTNLSTNSAFFRGKMYIR